MILALQIRAIAKQNMERYRSGHNEAVLKTVCPQGRVGSNPTLSVYEVSGAVQKNYFSAPLFVLPDESDGYL